MLVPTPTKVFGLFLTATLLVGQALGQCSGQAPGACQLSLTGVPNGSGMDWFVADIWNYQCSIIGDYNYPTQGVAIDSQLPYTVDINYLRFNSGFHVIGFCYAGYCFQGTFDCYVTGDFTQCQHSFPC